MNGSNAKQTYTITTEGTNITKSITIGQGYYLGVTAKVSKEDSSTNKYELLCMYIDGNLTTNMPVTSISGLDNGCIKVTESKTIKLEFFTAYKTALNPATSSDTSKKAYWEEVKVNKPDGKKESEQEYIIRRDTTWTVKLNDSALNKDTDMVMGIEYKVVGETTSRTTSTLGDEIVKYDPVNKTYTISDNVESLTPIVKAPVEMTVNTGISMKSEIGIVQTGTGSSIYVYEGEWTLTFAGNNKPSNASEAASIAFGKSTTTWTDSKGYKFTITEKSGTYVLTISKA